MSGVPGEITELRQEVAMLRAELDDTRRRAVAAAIAAGEALNLCTEMLLWAHDSLQHRIGGPGRPLEIAAKLNEAFERLRLVMEDDANGS